MSVKLAGAKKVSDSFYLSQSTKKVSDTFYLSHVTVKHPETALLTKHWLYVTTDGGETTEHLYLLHVTRIQRQEKAA